MIVTLLAKQLGTVEHLDDIAQSNTKTAGQRADARRGRA